MEKYFERRKTVLTEQFEIYKTLYQQSTIPEVRQSLFSAMENIKNDYPELELP